MKDGVVHLPLQKSKGRERMFALIDESEYQRVASFKWFAASSGRTFYARVTSGVIASHHKSMHAFIMKAEKGQRIDHINGNGLDNRLRNLRLASAAENSRNVFKRVEPCTSRFKGVIRTSSGKWASSIVCDGEPEFIGMFDAEEDAARSYDKRAVELFGEFAKTNEVMGLYSSPIALRSRSGLPPRHVEDLGEFIKAPAPKLEGSLLGDRMPVGAVIGVAKHPRTHKMMYKLDTGRLQSIRTYIGAHPSPDDVERMRQGLSDSV